MTTKPAPLWAAFVGGLATGHELIAIDVKSEIDRLFHKNEARRVPTQCVQLQDPADGYRGFKEDRGGNIVVFIGDVCGGDFYGPFSDEDVAEGFAGDVIHQHDKPEGGFTLFTVKD